ncbi:hypothetical protein ARMA_2753 [Ardenticatena maritima]|uniref:Uncharacterized protein n=1 Tax=Ardenticatena maritima TaxID=872965 RepID=A0A0M9UDU2_9CHLR|nr:hypothetical protein ARMA_2753 [Ardenticatena maritima]
MLASGGWRNTPTTWTRHPQPVPNQPHLAEEARTSRLASQSASVGAPNNAWKIHLHSSLVTPGRAACLWPAVCEDGGTASTAFLPSPESGFLW